MATGKSEYTSDDRLLGGRVVLRQPRDGYRAAIDPVLLAAAVEAKRGATLIDAGLGAGAAALCLLARRPDLRVIGIEEDADICALAKANAVANGVADRLVVRCGDLEIICGAMAQAGETVDGVLTNPPYLSGRQADAPTDAGRRRAHVEGLSLDGWVAACAGPLRRKGALTMIHRADRLDDVILALRGAGCGDIGMLPLWPKAGTPAGRIVVRARKSVAGAARLFPGLTLHDAHGAFTAQAEAVLRKGESLMWNSAPPPHARS